MSTNSVAYIQNPATQQAAPVCSSCGVVHNTGGTNPANSFSSVLSTQYNQATQYPQTGTNYVQYPQNYVSYAPAASTQQTAAAQVQSASNTAAPTRILTQKEHPELSWYAANPFPNVKNHELKGKRVIAQVGNEKVDGIVQRVINYNGVHYAEIDNKEKGNYKYVPVSAVTKIIERPKCPGSPSLLIRGFKGKQYFQLSPDKLNILGEWWFNKFSWKWKYMAYDEPKPVNSLPNLNAATAFVGASEAMEPLLVNPAAEDAAAESFGLIDADADGTEGSGVEGAAGAGSKGGSSNEAEGSGTIGEEGYGEYGEIVGIGAPGEEGTNPGVTGETTSEAEGAQGESSAGPEEVKDKPAEGKGSDDKGSEDKKVESKESDSKPESTGGDE